MKTIVLHKYQIGGLLLIVLAVFVTYLPAFKIQFYDGWWYMMWSATMDVPRFLIQFLDPANITQGYRPVQGIYMYLLYRLFEFDPDGYHLAHNLLHAANAALVFLLVGKLSKRWRLAFIAGLIYGILPNYSLAVFWHAVVDPLSAFFYLLTLLLWTRFLDTKTLRNYWIAFGAFILALFSKEVAVFLPLFLFLVEWWFYGEKPNLRIDLFRYLPFVLTFVPYLWLVYLVQSHGEFVGQFGFKIGPHMLNNLIPYMTILTAPWLVNLPTESNFFVWLVIVVFIYIGTMLYKRSKVLLFLALFAVLNISPLLGFPLDYFNSRYLYLSTISTAVVLAMILEVLWQRLGSRRLVTVAMSGIVACIVFVGSTRVADGAAGLAEYTRQVRVPFRDISLLHPTFPPDSYVYIVYSPLTNYWDFEGLFFSKYRDSVKVNATDLGKPADLRAHSNSFVYYFDSTNKPIELVVDKNISLRTTLTLPTVFEIPIVLEQYEIPTNRLERGKALVAILNWRTNVKIDKDYTVFAHLVDANGKQISQYDSPPGKGQTPTSQWLVNRTLVDAVVVPIPVDAPLGDHYRLELGMYDVESMKNLAIVDARGNLIDDKIVIESFSVVK
ncbi:MAG: glycosyltransferase family 39 protein [Chloroflexi bacterium]|nr:glycosyltransferase family 39 protein [Chloroflexota bacterium]